MKKYLLLRDNHESGPYDLEKLSSLGLRPLDLIWIEEESTCWRNPDEIEDLKPFIKQEPLYPSPNIDAQRIFVSLPEDFSGLNLKTDEETRNISFNENEATTQGIVNPIKEWRESYKADRQKKPVWNKKLFQHAHHANIVAIFIGVVFAAFVMKKLVDETVKETPVETAVATPIIEKLPEQRLNENFKNALVTEVVPVYKTPLKKSKKLNVKNHLKLKTNNYKVGLFGGIEGLQLTVFNMSAQHVEKALVVLDYLRPNGDVVQSENLLFKNIKPGKSQTISIPGSSRGVKVKYKVLKAVSRDYKPDLKEI